MTTEHTQEPWVVGQCTWNEDGNVCYELKGIKHGSALDARLITTPPQRTWVGLTADEMESLYQQATYMDDTDHIHMLMMAEAKLKDKNV